MALSKNDERLLELLLKERNQSIETKKQKPFHIRALQFSMVFLSLLLFITVGTLGILTLSKPQVASASNTYTETWTATGGVYALWNGSNNVTYQSGTPSNGTLCGYIYSLSSSSAAGCQYTVSAWSVSGTIN